MQTSCPEVTTLADFASGRLPSIDVARVEQHLDSCAQCSALLPAGVQSGTGHSGLTSPGPDQVLPSGTVLGRYEVRRWIGRGAMGDVYEGFDPELERKVALKLLHPAIATDDRIRSVEGVADSTDRTGYWSGRWGVHAESWPRTARLKMLASRAS